MSMRDRLMAEIEEYLYGERISEPEPRTETHSIVHDTFDQLTWEMLKSTSKMVSKADQDFRQFFDTGKEALEDLFNLLYQSDPRLTGTSEMMPEFLANHRIMEEFSRSEEVKDLRKITYLDDYQSGFAVLAMQQALYDALSRVAEADARRQEAAEALKAAQDALQALVDSGADEDALAAAFEAAQGLQDALAANQKAVDDAASGVTLDLQFAAQYALDEIKDSTRAEQAYGLSEGELKRMEFDKRRHLTERLRKGRMKDLAKVIGGWKATGKAQRRQRVKNEPNETYDYALGNDLDMLVPSELEALAIPEMEDLWLLRYVQGELLTRKVRGPAHAGQGPIIVVCDESQSMGEHIDKDTTKEMWSKAVALAMADQAKKEKRDFTYIGFCTQVVYEAHFPAGDIPLDKMVDFVEHFGNGGTSFGPPLARALELIQQTERRDQARPDILFLTDGEGQLTHGFAEVWKAALERTDGTCYAIQIGTDEEEAVALSQLTDKVMRIDQFNSSPEGVADLFRTI